jgi:translocation and assembly module TamB
MRLLRWILALLAGLVLLVVLAAAGLWWWAGTEGSAQWALEQLARRQPVTAEGVTGSLRRGMRAGRIAWRQDGLAVEARDAQLAWQPLALLQRHLRLDHLRAALVRVEDRRPPTGERPRPPASLALPLRVSVDELAVGRIEVAGATPLDLRDLAASYAYDGAAHRLELRNLRVFDGHYRGELRLGAEGDLPLDASLQGRIVAPVPGGAAPVPLVFQARAGGTLTALDAQARLQAEPGGPTPSATRATVTARITPFAELPLVQARAQLEAVDVGALWPQAPHTLLSGQVAVEPQGAQAWAVSADLRNALPGPWDRRRLPAERVRLAGDWRLPARVLVRELEAGVGGGRVLARGQWEGEDAWTVEGTVRGVDPSAAYSTLAAVPLDGRVALRGEGAAIAFDTLLEAAGPARRRTEIDAAVAALELRSLQARGRWAGEELSLPLLAVRTADARADAALDLRPGRRSGRGRIDLEAPGLRLRAVGSLAPASGGGNARATVSSVHDAQQWLLKLPGLPADLGAMLLAGRGEAQLAWQGGWDDPSVEGTLSLPQLQPEAATGTAAPWSLRDVSLRVDGRLADARVELKGQAQAGERDLSLDLSGRGGQRRGGSWQGQLSALNAGLRDRSLGPGLWRLALRRPVDLQWSAGRLDAGVGEAVLTAPVAAGAPAPSSAVLAWEPLRWDGQQLRTAGTLSGLPIAWVELLGGPQLAGSTLAGDLVFDARWDATVGDTLRARASLVRRSGDVSVLAEAADGAAARVQAGVRDARLELEADGEAVVATARWESERAGQAQARLASRLVREGEGWTWPESAPLSGTVRAQLPRLGVWSLLAPPGWRLRGSLSADVSIAGTRADPALAGSLRADDLALRSVVDGIALQDGRLRARLDGRRLVIEEFVLRGAGQGGGTLTGAGEGSWQREGVQVRVTATLDRLRASARSDRELTVSGQVVARMDAGAAELRGDLRVDRARIALPEETAPRLGEDVVVRNLPPGVVVGKEAPAARDGQKAGGRPVTLAVNLDLGNDFRVQGRGIQTRLAGALAVTGESVTEPRLVGMIRTIGGEYRAYGQRLDIERGVLRFTGPADNPALDILAIRPRLAQRVGVQVTGTAQAPFVRLYAEPDLPEAEKLAWLVLGRPAAAGGAETALLQSAALALIQSRTGSGGGKGPAALLGLDELGFRREGAEGPAVTLGKRLGRNLYASYERSLSGALGTLYVFYDLSRRLTVRAQAGERAAVDLIFTFAYD